MAEHTRPAASAVKHSKLGTGIYAARIINHLDKTGMGCLEVTLLKTQANQVGNKSQSYVVNYAPPFFGYTNFEQMGQNTADKSTTLDAYNDTQKSYGMWFVPPDVGVTVLVVFVDGDASRGYWFAAVPSRFANNMVPAIAGSSAVDMDKNDSGVYDTKKPLPVGEVNRRNNSKDQQMDVDKIKKPLHPMAACYLEQGLIEDDIRGVTDSSSRREAPSMVFGISTPGPFDRRKGAKKAPIGTNQSQTTSPIPVSRLGGTQFVMDDGHDGKIRETPASTGPMKYMDVIKGEKGDSTIPYNEYFRIRTRTGHQILMHNSEDLIYIGNGRGTAWVELTSNGKIDIYSQDSISIHTENDLNIRADRDINMEAGRNFNLSAGAVSGLGGIHMESAGNTSIVIGANGQITTTTNLDIATGSSNKISAGTTTHIKSGGNFIATADQIHMNGIEATAAAPAAMMKVHDNPLTSSGNPWKTDRYQSKKPIQSILKRIPMHEPWSMHENLDPTKVVPDKTDISKEGKKRGE
jgi:hypothetical protein